MANWEELSETEQRHANAIMAHYNALPSHKQQDVLSKTLHELDHWVRSIAPAAGGTLVAAYLFKRYRLGR